MTIKDLCKQAHKIAVDKGFWNCPFFDGGTCCSPEFEGQTEISSDYCEHKCLLHKANIDKRNTSELLMLIVSELGEACEALRKGDRQTLYTIPSFGKKIWKKDTFEDELADAIIRICDLAESQGIDLEWQIQNKLEYNKTRPYKHGKEF